MLAMLTKWPVVAIMKHQGWHDFRYCRLTHRWYGFPPHLNVWNSLDVMLPSLVGAVSDLCAHIVGVLRGEA